MQTHEHDTDLTPGAFALLKPYVSSNVSKIRQESGRQRAHEWLAA